MNSFEIIPNCVPKSMRINPNQYVIIWKNFSISFVENRFEINPTQSQTSIWICPNSFELKSWFGFVLTHSDRSLELSRINFQAIFNKRDWKLFLDWFALARTQIRDSSELVPIRNFLQSIFQFFFYYCCTKYACFFLNFN